jgi:heterotetrameric sarcosine oxidase delta subunit
MRLTCPECGERDSREFAYKGAAKLMDRPKGDAGPEAFHDYVHVRDNPAGPLRELWQHEFGCRAWLVVTRNTVTHAVLGSEMAATSRAGKR